MAQCAYGFPPKKVSVPAIFSAVLALISIAVPADSRASFASLARPIAAVDSTAPAALDGVVTDSLRRPVAGVEIFSSDGRFKATTNSVGAFHIGGIHSGPVTLTVRKIGYGAGEFTLAMEPGITRYQTIVLTRLNNVLTPVVVAETQSHRGLRDVGFYERAGNARGTFLTPEILATRPGVTRSSDFLQAVNGVKVMSDSRGGLPFGIGGYMAISSRVAAVASGYCLMNVYIDGVRTDLGTPTDRGLAASRDEKVNLEDVISSQDIGAIEIYPSGVTSPQRYTGVSQGCGTILIWTKVKLNLPRSSARN